MSYFSEPYTNKNIIEVELNLSNYATKSNLKNATGVDTSQFSKKYDLANLESEVDKLGIAKFEKVPNGSNSLKIKVDKLDVDKLKPVPYDLNKLSDVGKNDVVKKTECDELVKSFNATDTSKLVNRQIMMLRSGVFKTNYLVLLV